MNTPHINYNSDKIEGYKLEIQERLTSLYALCSPVGEKFDVGERVPDSATVDPQDTSMAPVSVSGTFLSPPLPMPYGILTVHPTFSSRRPSL